MKLKAKPNGVSFQTRKKTPMKAGKTNMPISTHFILNEYPHFAQLLPCK